MMIEIEHHRDHSYVMGPKGSRGCKQELADGKLCGRSKQDPLHHGPPPSLNAAGSGGNHFAYQNSKKLWQSMWLELLKDAGMPQCDSVMVEGQCCFPDRRKRDQGNFRYFVEKTLGDTLRDAGMIEDDDWDHYEFGQLAKTYEKNQSWIKLILFPM